MRRFVAVHHETGELLCSGPVLDDIRDERGLLVSRPTGSYQYLHALDVQAFQLAHHD